MVKMNKESCEPFQATGLVSRAQTFILYQQRYLMKYGYLPMSDIETGNLRTLKQLQEAIKVMQRFGHIPQTGKLDIATKELMTKPRCSLPDIPPDSNYDWARNQLRLRSRRKRFVKQGSKWETTKLTWGLNSYPPGVNRQSRDGKGVLSKWDVRHEFKLATEVWSNVSKLEFNEVQRDPRSSDIVIDFKTGYHGDGYPFDGRGRTLAHAFYPGPGVGGNMHFDSDEPWVQHKHASPNYESVSLFITAAHELGHSLGLYHSDVRGALMSPYLISFPGDFVLPEDDTRAIQEIYGASDDYYPKRPIYNEPTPRTDTPPPRSPPDRRPRPPSGPSDKPDTCDTHYDAISVIRGEIYVFSGKYFWRIDSKGRPRPNYPAEIVHFWPVLPSNLTKVDAVYEKSHDGRILFFIDNRYYICRGNEELLETGPLHRFGLPKNLPRVDAAFIWGHNGRTYFFADTMYWRFEEDISYVELDYPRDMAVWRGVPYHIDSAFKYNGTTYFFKGRKFYEFDDLRMKTSPRSPLLSSPFWFNCPNQLTEPYYTKNDINSAISAFYCIRLLFISSFFISFIL